MCSTYRGFCVAIVTHVALSHVLTHWSETALGLAESARKRARQEPAAILS